MRFPLFLQNTMKPIASRLSLPLFASFSMVLAATVQAQSTWNGSNGNWSNDTSWTPAGVPAPGADIVIADTTANGITLDGTTSRMIGSLQFGDAGTRASNFSINTQIGNTLTINDGVMAGGAFPVSGALTMRGNFLVPTDQIWTVGGSNDDTKDQGIFIREAASGVTNRGKLTLNGNLTKEGTGQLNFAAIDVVGAGNIVVNDGDLKFNAGASQPLVIGGTGNITVNGTAILAIYKNSGTLNVTRPILMNGTSRLSPRSNVVDVASPIAFNGTHVLDPNNTTNLTGAWTGSGTVNRSGTGTLNLNGDTSAFTGTLNLSDGTTTLSSAFGGTVSQTAGTLGGEAVVAGPLSLSGGNLRVNPGTPASLGTTGNLTLSGTTTVVLSENPASNAPFTILNYGSLSGDETNLTLAGTPANYRSFVFSTAASGIVTLAIDLQTRTWAGGDGTWDIGVSPNWNEGDNKFYQLDKVVFGNTGPATVAMVGALSPSSITVDSDSNYEFTATAGNSITGLATLTKSGSGTLKLGGVNSFTGPIAITGGTVAPTTDQAFGLNGRTINVTAGGAIDTNGAMNASARNYRAVIAGDGPDDLGAIVNNSAINNNNGFGTIQLADNATIGGVSRFDLRPSSAGGGVLDLAGFTLSKIGANTIAIVESVATAAGDIDVNAGILSITRCVISGAGAVNVNPSGTLRFENYTSGSFSKNLNVDDALVWTSGGALTVNAPVTVTGVSNFQCDAALTLAGTVTGTGELRVTGAAALVLSGDASPASTNVMAGTLQIGNGGATGTLAGPVADAANVAFNRSDAVSYGGQIDGIGALTQMGTGTLTLTGANTYTGSTNVTSGILALGADDRIAASSNLVMTNAAGAAFDLAGNDQEFRNASGGGILGGNIVNSGAGASVLTLRPAGGDNIQFFGSLQGNVRLEVRGSKTAESFSAPRQRLAGTANTFTGGTLVDGATLLARLDSSLGEVPASFDAENITLQNHGVLLNEADGNALTIPPTRGITIGSGGGGFVAGFGNIFTVQSVISGAAGNPLTVMANNGTLVLTGANTYLGDTIMPPPSPGNVSRLRIGDGGVTGSISSASVVNDGELSFNRTDDPLFAPAISGTGTVTQLGSGNLTLTAVNTYTGNTNVTAGTLTLADNAGLKFLVTDASSNQIGGTGTLQINGDFTIDTSALTVSSGTWSLVDKTTLAADFGGSFTVAGPGWTESANVWSKSAGGKTLSFSEATGVLTVSAGNSYASYIAGFDFSAFPGADLTPSGDPDGDGIANAVEFVLGNAPNVGKVENLPTVQLVANPAGLPAGEYLKFSYRRTSASVAANVGSAVEYDTDLAGPWTTATNGAAGVVIQETPNAGLPGVDVVVYLPKTLGAGGKLFSRLSVQVP